MLRTQVKMDLGRFVMNLHQGLLILGATTVRILLGLHCNSMTGNLITALLFEQNKCKCLILTQFLHSSNVKLPISDVERMSRERMNRRPLTGS